MQNWLISRGGEESGPLTAFQVRELLASGEIRTGDTLARRESESNWQKLAVSGVLAEAAMAGLKRPDGLPVPSAVKAQATQPTATVDTSSADPSPAPAPTPGTLKIDPYQTPASLEIGSGFQSDQVEYPGIGRLAYFLFQIAVTVVTYGISFIGVRASSGGSLEGAVLVGMVVMVLGSIVGIYLGVKRVQNLGMSGWAVLWTLVPIMSVWIGWRMYACPPGYEYHRQLDLAGKILTWSVVGLIVLGIVLNIVVAASAGVS